MRNLVKLDLNRLAKEFGEPSILEDLKNARLLVSVYDTGYYEGYAFVLFEKDGVLYEVNCSHCSCFGLEGQWKPKKTYWKAIEMRKNEWFIDEPEQEDFTQLIEENLKKELDE